MQIALMLDSISAVYITFSLSLHISSAAIFTFCTLLEYWLLSIIFIWIRGISFTNCRYLPVSYQQSGMFEIWSPKGTQPSKFQNNSSLCTEIMNAPVNLSHAWWSHLKYLKLHYPYVCTFSTFQEIYNSWNRLNFLGIMFCLNRWLKSELLHPFTVRNYGNFCLLPCCFQFFECNHN